MEGERFEIINPNSNEQSFVVFASEEEIIEDINENEIFEIESFPGETILLQIDRTVELNFPQMDLRTKGTLVITNLRLAFVYGNELGQSRCENTIVPLTTIFSAVHGDANRSNFYSYSTAPIVPEVEIKTKDFRLMRFRFETPAAKEQVMTVLAQHAFFGRDIQHCFAFSRLKEPSESDPLVTIERKHRWKDILSDEFTRLNFSKHGFELSTCNDSFQICGTYPQHIITPASLDSSTLQQGAQFRAGRRFPAVTWIHPTNKAVISRSAQPKSGLRGNRNEFDESVVHAIFAANPTSSEKKMYVIDCRAKLAAQANMLKGAGFENPEYYGQCNLEFMGIENIHTMRTSFLALLSLYIQRNVPERLTLEGTKWLDHIKLLLISGSRVAKLVDEEGASVLVHCSDGWDRTAQLTSLAQVLLDPYYRTMEGFCALIQKEWLSFGHKFNDRLGHGTPEELATEFSPIFLQFLDAVWQIMSQFPNYFEFNERFLIVILDNIYNCRFGTFLFNSEKERRFVKLEETTPCFWDWLLRPTLTQKFKNNHYSHYDKRLVPNDSTSVLQFWSTYYQRFKHEMQRFHQHLVHTQNGNHPKSTLQLRKENEQLRTLLHEEKRRTRLYERLLIDQLKNREEFRQKLLQELTKQTARNDVKLESFDFAIDYENDNIVFKIKPKDAANTAVVTKYCSDLSTNLIDNYAPPTHDAEAVPVRRRSRARRPIVPELNNNALALRASLNHSLLAGNAPLVASTRDLVRVTLGKLFDWLGGWGWTAPTEGDLQQLANGHHFEGTADVANGNDINGHTDTDAAPDEPRKELDMNGHDNDTVNNTDVNTVEGNSRSAEQ
eukprot:TRINITY_DN6036_c0_g1_i1.p1 TRINITY_DN6036_c0_g1~~TRINITY_DN6036_c0_g1_i1.p1  ORF type:complete len:836 (-),score=184.30 TRINITY_DN6036_c0_g1_i1:61-2568(-)